MKAHTPLVQARPALATCGSVVQSMVQLPQVWTSLSETHPAAHSILAAPHPLAESPAEAASAPPAASSPAAASPLSPASEVDPDTDPSVLPPT